MDYIKEGYKSLVFDSNYSQVFKNKPTTVIDEKNIIKLRNDKHITDSDMEIVKFLFNYRFGTLETLTSLLKRFGKHEEDVRKDLSRLVKHRIINAFGFVESKEIKMGVKVELPMDALLIYCLDLGGRILVGHFHNMDTTAWYTTENMRGPEKVGKDLVTNLFHLELINGCNFKEDSNNYFKLNPVLALNKQRVVPAFEMKIMVNDKDFKYYIGDVVRKCEFPSDFREHLTKLDSVMATNAWKKYFYNVEKAPVVFFVCEDDLHALEVARMIVGTSSFDAALGFRLTTDERIKKGLGTKGAFLAYDESTDSLVEKKVASFNK
jgi:hypothetical protein